MCLSIILDELQTIFPAQLRNPLRHRTPSVQMHDTYRFRPRCYSRFDQRIINLQRLASRFDQHRLQTILRDAQDRRDIRVGRNDDFVPRLHYAQLDVRTEDPYQRIQSIGTADGKITADVLGIMAFKLFILFALQIPSAVDHSSCCLTDLVSVHGRDIL